MLFLICSVDLTASTGLAIVCTFSAAGTFLPENNVKQTSGKWWISVKPYNLQNTPEPAISVGQRNENLLQDNLVLSAEFMI